jgi:GGDEF domain-containing protein
VLLHPAPEPAVVTAVGERIIAEITGGTGPAVGASVGVAYQDGGEHTVRSLLGEADAALYRAKAAGKGVVAGLELIGT